MVEAGVPLFDRLEEGDVIWVYFPVERWESLHGGGWVCDLMTFVNGKVEARADLRFSDRYLSTMMESLPDGF